MEEQGEPRSRWLPIYPWLWWATVPMLLMVTMVLWAAMQQEEFPFWMILRFLLGMCAPLLILPQLVYFLSGRSKLAASIVFGLVCASWYGMALYAFLHAK